MSAWLDGIDWRGVACIISVAGFLLGLLAFIRWLPLDLIRYMLEPTRGYTSRIGTAWCRLRSHPAGIVFFNPGGLEPDYHCRNCGDDCG